MKGRRTQKFTSKASKNLACGRYFTSLFPLPYEKTSVDFFALFMYMHFNLAFGPRTSGKRLFDLLQSSEAAVKGLEDKEAGLLEILQDSPD